MLSKNWILDLRNGQAYSLDAGRFLIGSGVDVGIHIPHESVDPVHAELECSDRGFLLRDLGSRLGTWVGSTSVGQDSSPVLDTFKVGQVRCWLRAEEHQVSVPQLTQPQGWNPAYLADGVPACSVDGSVAATHQCPQCFSFYGRGAMRTVGLKGSQRLLLFCPSCSSKCVSLVAADARRRSLNPVLRWLKRVFLDAR